MNKVHVTLNGNTVASAKTWKEAREKLDKITRDMTSAEASIYDETGEVREYVVEESTSTVMKERRLPTGVSGSTESLIQAFEYFCMVYERENAPAVFTALQLFSKQFPMPVKEIHTDEYFCPLCHAEIDHCEDGVVTDKFCPQCGQRLETYPKIEVN